MYKWLSIKVYAHAYKFLLYLWSISAIIQLIFSKYYTCVKPYEDLYRNIAMIALLIFGILSIMMLIHLLKYKNDTSVMIDEEYTEKGAILGGGEIKYLVIPIYALMIFSISKLLIAVVDYNSAEDYASMIWIALFIGSSGYWFYIKGKGEKVWDFKLSMIVFLYTVVVIFWESTFMPFIKSILDIGQCVNKQIIELKIDDSNETIYDYTKIIKQIKQ